MVTEPAEPRQTEVADEPVVTPVPPASTAKHARRADVPFDLPTSPSTNINMHRQGRVIE